MTLPVFRLKKTTAADTAYCSHGGGVCKTGHLESRQEQHIIVMSFFSPVWNKLFSSGLFFGSVVVDEHLATIRFADVDDRGGKITGVFVIVNVTVTTPRKSRNFVISSNMYLWAEGNFEI